MRVRLGSKTSRRFGVVGGSLGAVLALSTVLGLAPAEAVVNTKTVRVYTGSLPQSFFVVIQDQGSTCFEVPKTNAWTTTNVRVNVGDTVWVRTFALGCNNAAGQLIDSTPRTTVPADDLQYYWVTTKE
jgi:hypothetical protein